MSHRSGSENRIRAGWECHIALVVIIGPGPAASVTSLKLIADYFEVVEIKNNSDEI